MQTGAKISLTNSLFYFSKEENRNLCESEPDKAECIREVEEAKQGKMSDDRLSKLTNILLSMR